VYGYDYGTVRSRIDLFAEGLERISARLKQLKPAPVRNIPILIGGSGEKRMLPLVGRDAASGPAAASDAILLSPIDGRTEVWAAGITYNRSRQARMEESATADVYDLLYDSDRPECIPRKARWHTVQGKGSGASDESVLV